MRSRGVWLPCFLLLSGCASLGAPATPPTSFPAGEGVFIQDVPAIAQRAYQCGPTALESVLRYWGRPVNPDEMRQALVTPGARGVLNFTLANYPRTQGLWTEVHQADRDDIRAWLRRGIPPIVMLRVGPWGVPTHHYVVVRGFNDREGVYYANVGDAAPQAIRYATFERRWRDARHWCLIAVPPERVDWDLTADQAGDMAVMRFNLANAHLRLREWDAASVIYQELLEESPEWGAVSNNLAWIAVEQGKPDEAIRLIEQAFAAGARRDYDILDTLGLAHCRLQQHEAAQTYFLEAIRTTPSPPSDAVELIQRHINECAP